MRKLADWLFSIYPVLIGMLCIIVYLILETTALLYQVLPGYVANDWYRWPLSAFLSVSFHLTVLNISVNSEIINRAFSVIVALLGVVLTAYFFQVFSLEGIAQYQAATFAVIVGFCGYAYVFMFTEKHKRSLKSEDQAAEITRLKAEIQQLNQQFSAQTELVTQLNSDKEKLTERLKSRNSDTEIRSAARRTADKNIQTAPAQPLNGHHKVNDQSVACEVCQKQFKNLRAYGNRKSYCRNKNPENCKRNLTLQADE